MRRLLLLIFFGGIFYFLWTEENLPSFDTVKKETEAFFQDEQFQQLKDEFFTFFGLVKENLEELQDEEKEKNAHKKPDLSDPTEHTFSIYNIEIGDEKKKVEQVLGEAKRVTVNEYGMDWYTYHDNYQNFVKIMYDENEKVVGLYTNQDLIRSSHGISRGTTKEEVKAKLGDPETKIVKGYTYFEIPNDANYELFLIDDSFVTIFYDIHENNTVTAIQIIAEKIENEKKSFYVTGTESLKEGFEYQMFDLVNATRAIHGLSLLTWDDHVRNTARDHSLDMAENNYFSHTNLKGESPFDRMEEDDVFFTFAGENLAYGQFSSIFAHEGLMNSKGHRENILNKEFEYLGVGVAFNEESQPFFTQKYFAD